jgi:hypothetical protein
LHGSAFYFFRDHNLSAYPALKRDPASPDPFFQRRQFGFTVGGPVSRDRLFFFGNWERTQQRGVATTTLFGPDFAHLSGTTSIPLFGDELSFRLDGRLSSKHTAFVRYSHDGSRAFGPGGIAGNANTYPSNWVESTWANVSLLGITSSPATLVNDSAFVRTSATISLGGGAGLSRMPGHRRAHDFSSSAILFIGQSITSRNPLPLSLNDPSPGSGHAPVRFLVSTGSANRGGSPAQGARDHGALSPDEAADTIRPQNGRGLQPASAAFHTLNDVLQLPLQHDGEHRRPAHWQANGSMVRS